MAISMYRLSKTLNGILTEMQGINASAVELMEETGEVEKILEEV
ncbi:hypothetical protein [Thermococcus sp. 21S7]|nr:hypothetical protein [Thermococcus sp. 21S7]